MTNRHSNAKFYKSPLFYLCISIVVAIAVWTLEKPGRPRHGSASVTRLFAGLDTSKIARIQIEHLINGIEFRKTLYNWKAAPFKTSMQDELEENEGAEEGAQTAEPIVADSAKVRNLIDTLKNTRVETIISANPEKQAQLLVNKLGLQVRAYDASGNILAHLYVGKNGPDYMTTYVRREGENNVYLVKQYLGPLLIPQIDAWKYRSPWQKAVDVVDVKNK